MLLPLAVVIEVGNHVGQCAHDRYRVAQRFKDMVQGALRGDAPFALTPLPDVRVWSDLLDRFPDWAVAGSGIGDLSILHEWERQRERFPSRAVYIWSLDRHLAGYRHELT